MAAQPKNAKKTVPARNNSNSMSGKKSEPKDKLLPRLTMFFFDRPWFTVILWLTIVVFGVLSYTTFLRREGFPSVNIPVAIVSGTYFVNDPAKVDEEVAKPISDLALKQSEINAVQSQSADNFFTVTIQYKEGTDAKAAVGQIEQQAKTSGAIPESAQLQFNVPYFGATGGDPEKIDVAISFYDKENNTSTAELTAKANEAATWLSDKQLSDVQKVFVKSPMAEVTNPSDGKTVTVQRSFDRYGTRENNETKYFNSVIIGISSKEGVDVIHLDDQIRHALDELAGQQQFSGYDADVSASFAPSIEESIAELQRVLLEGLIAVLIVGSILIALRASIITVIAMITVLLAALSLLYLVGYTLNVITLFALILALALIVDDTIIMVEAIDAARHRTKDRREAVRQATRKISRAMLAATITAALSFAPLLFVGGVLGSFIRAIPVTTISALIISLFVALIFIPFFARFLLLGKKQMGKKGVLEVASGFENAIANFLAKPMLWARHSRRRLFTLGLSAVFIGLAFIIGGMLIARNVVFNIFPPTKDTNGVVLSMSFPPGTSIEKAQEIAAKADDLAADEIGGNFIQGAYFNTGTAQGAMEQIMLISYTERDITSQQLVKDLQERYNNEFTEAVVAVGQLDVGPPAASFIIQINAENRDAALQVANDMSSYLSTLELKRVNGTTAHLTNVTVSSADQYLRDDGKPIITVSAGFDASDTTTLVTLAQEAVKNEFDSDKLATYGLPEDAVSFNLGQEEENQESFQALVLAFPALLVVMYLLLAIQFRSLLQPLLIFMAIPFSIFGVMFGLNLTDNAISFFTMMGFFALVGLSIKNTILLTDFANQARLAGNSVVDSAVAALRERFRPLFATSMTAVFSLIPLALTSPFWEGLAVVLIFGLLSSTLLVVTVFPYYYLGAEYLRLTITRKSFLIWLFVTIIGVVAVTMLTNIGLGLLVIPLSLITAILQGFYAKRLVK